MRILFFVLTLAFGGCGSSTPHYSKSSPNYSGAGSYSTKGLGYGGGIENGFEANKEGFVENEMMAYTAKVSLKVMKKDSLMGIFPEIAKKYEGHVVQNGNNYAAIRINAKYLKEAIAEVSALGKKAEVSLNGTEVSETYADLQLRLESSKKTQKRYLELLEKANTVEDILKIEKELERITLLIEQLTAKINQTAKSVTYTTISISMEPLQRPGLLGYVFVGAYKGISWLFVRKR